MPGPVALWKAVAIRRNLAGELPYINSHAKLLFSVFSYLDETAQDIPPSKDFRNRLDKTGLDPGDRRCSQLNLFSYLTELRDMAQPEVGRHAIILMVRTEAQGLLV
jgi:hypothetical protein